MTHTNGNGVANESGIANGQSVDHRSLPSIFTPQRKLSVICIGAGASGLLLAYKLQRHFDKFDLKIFEKNPEVSGTWFENRYPGCACDVPAHCYTWSFEPKTDWSANYASSKEIFQYFKDFSTKYNLQQYIKLEHQVIGAIWDEKVSKWHVQTKNLKTGRVSTDSAHVLINAGGILNAWRYPPIPGIETFKGRLVHSAAWPEDLDLKGKVVGLIGNGSSGIQILPAIKGEVKELKTFIREATWVAPPVGEEFKAFSFEEQQKFIDDPEYHLAERQKIERRMNSNFAVFHTDSESQKKTREYMTGLMEQRLHNEKLSKLLIPNWSVGCRRLTPGTNYLESLSDDNVNVIYGEITQITETGVICNDGAGEHTLEVLICATGFDTTFKPRFPLIGSTGEQLSTLWKDDPKAYFGIAAEKCPNYFFTLGPNCPIGNGPVLISIEAEVEYIIQMLSKFQKENFDSFQVKAESVQEFNVWKDEFMKHTIWTEECRSWYKVGNSFGKVLALWPGSTMHYLESLKAPRWEDWNYKYPANKNKYTYLGNGHSTAEAQHGDLSFYIRNGDDSPIDPVLKKLEAKVEAETAGGHIAGLKAVIAEKTGQLQGVSH